MRYHPRLFFVFARALLTLSPLFHLLNFHKPNYARSTLGVFSGSVTFVPCSFVIYPLLGTISHTLFLLMPIVTIYLSNFYC
ncbi:hypothetical protein EV426DRAFT_610118 [Tirmania nivea]|nr:hypothetical protein EV426DRAFT_610118 [Tirmania nivea]